LTSGFFYLVFYIKMYQNGFVGLKTKCSND